MSNVIRVQFRTSGSPDPKVGLLPERLMKCLLSSPHTEGLLPETLAMASLTATVNDLGEMDRFMFQTHIREKMVRNFGIGAHLKFLDIEVCEEHDLDEQVPQDYILDQVKHYLTEHFPRINTEMHKVIYAALTTVLEYPGCRVVSNDARNWNEVCNYQLWINIKNDKEKYGLRVTIDMLPLLLDHLALEMTASKLPTT